MAFLEFVMDLKSTNRLLERIANALERICIHTGIPLRDPIPIQEPKQKSQVRDEVMVDTDEDRMRKDLEAVFTPIDPQVEDEIGDTSRSRV